MEALSHQEKTHPDHQRLAVESEAADNSLMTGIKNRASRDETNMKHGITEQEWNDYLEGTADDQTRDRLEAHLIGCLSCWETYEQLAQATSALRCGGARVRAELSATDQDLLRGARATFGKLAAAESKSAASDSTQPPAPEQLIPKRLDELEALLIPMCGSRTANRAMRTAAKTSPACSLEQVNAETWTPFLANLTSIAGVMCGETGAHLIWERGQW
jgi:hypothetical protein